MPRGKSPQDLSMLAMALVGYELEKKKIDERIREIRAQLAGGALGKEPSIDDNAPKKRRKLSAAARKKIAAAQKKRWAEHRQALARPT
jgi:hypothetical protein